MATIRVYGSYSFRDKDPAIDKLRTAIQDRCGGKLNGKVLRKVSEMTGSSQATRVSPTTLDNWFFGKTRRPQHASLGAVAGGLGLVWDLVDKKKGVYVPIVVATPPKAMAKAARRKKKAA